jgi:hypothetical protein
VNTVAWVLQIVLAARLATGRPPGLIRLVTHAFAGREANGLALAYGYDTAFWWTAVIAGGAIIAALLFRPGLLFQPPSPVKR